MTDPGLVLVPLGAPVLEALLREDLEAASQEAEAPLSAWLLEEGWRVDRPAGQRGLWRIRLDQAADDPAWRRHGYGTRLVGAALAWATTAPGVRVVRASISPDNAASLATLRPFGFAPVGEQVDEEDGLELLFEREVVPTGDEARAPG